MVLFQIEPLPIRLWLMSNPPSDDGRDTGEKKALLGGEAMLRVLIVEDEFFISLDTEALLRALGHTLWA